MSIIFVTDATLRLCGWRNWEMDTIAQKINIKQSSILTLPVIIGGLGYFVDMYDLVLFSVVRVPSPRDMGIAEQSIMNIGVTLFNAQMLGMLLGGILWGVFGDKYGRVKTLYGSILIYSTANLLNAFISGVPAYAFLRFIAGIGLAGELGAAVTLVVETLPKDRRGYGTTIIASVGILGALPAALITQYFSWRAAYFIGGVLGFVLLIMRFRLQDSMIFKEALTNQIRRGNFISLFTNRNRAKRYLKWVAVGIPLWFVLGILVVFAPEITSELNVSGTVIVATAVIYQFVGAACGNVIAGLLSQYMGSRIKVISIFTALTAVTMCVYLFSHDNAPNFYYELFFVLGIVTGHWGVFATAAAEQFGTDLRASAATSIPNVVRSSVIPMTLAIQAMRPYFGLKLSVLSIGCISVGIAFYALRTLKESFGRDLAFTEEY